MFQDVRYGARMLLKHRLLTLVAVLSLGLGIGATSSIYALISNQASSESNQRSMRTSIRENR